MTPDNFTVPKASSGMVSIGREAAIALAESNWWEGRSHREIAGFCLSVQELCCPFPVFHEALEGAIGRPVWTHELGMNLQGIFNEFHGTETAPTMEQIIELIPEEKRVIVYANPSPSDPSGGSTPNPEEKTPSRGQSAHGKGIL